MGPDSRDPLTQHAEGKVTVNLLRLLKRDALIGQRIGVLRQLSDRENDPRVSTTFEKALKDMTRLGATIKHHCMLAWTAK